MVTSEKSSKGMKVVTHMNGWWRNSSANVLLFKGSRKSSRRPMRLEGVIYREGCRQRAQHQLVGADYVGPCSHCKESWFLFCINFYCRVLSQKRHILTGSLWLKGRRARDQARAQLGAYFTNLGKR